MSSKGFTVYMFQSDFEHMQKWVLKYPCMETGGDLFGLWSDQDNAVIHIVLGPGENCTHGEYHFYQDVDYLERIGKLLTTDYMLGHIGEWHSHHQLKLDEPSDGDCRTIERNFPKGSCGFFLMIANIIAKDQVQIVPYLFKGNWNGYRRGQIEIIGYQSPFPSVSSISSSMELGKEKNGHQSCKTE